MKEDIIRIESISQLCEVAGFDKPTHPLITIIDNSKWVIGKEMVNVKFAAAMYSIGIKDKNCGLQYGRNCYDFDEGVMYFTAPNQVASTTKEQKLNEVHGYTIYFHPDLIRNSHLESSIDTYNFFSYDVYEALHLSDKEQQLILDSMERIRIEISERIDNHSNRVIVTELELLLNYSLRFYERQFNTRNAQNKDIVSQVEQILKEYYNAGSFTTLGAPTLQVLGEKTRLSQHYLSDLLKKETGRSAKDHINDFIVEKAKTLLLTTNESVSELAYGLGFNYPHYFSRLFKSKTGFSPVEYRQLN